jgi:hypothetical protein
MLLMPEPPGIWRNPAIVAGEHPIWPAISGTVKARLN